MYELVAGRLKACGACVVGVVLVVLGAIAHSLTDIRWLPFLAAALGAIVFVVGVVAYRHAVREMQRKHEP